MPEIAPPPQLELPNFAQELSKEVGPTATRIWMIGNKNMHEVSIMEEAVRLAVDAAESSGADRVTGLRLRVGALSGVVPEALRFAFDVVCRGTSAEGASLEIESVAAASWCPVCRAEFGGTDFYNECPRCHKVSGDLQRGREIEIASVEMN